MAFSAEEQELYDWLKSSLPSWLFQDDDAAEEVWGAIVKGIQPVRAQVDSWRAALEILQAEDIWLNQHARDRGTFRQASETDAALRSRLRTVEDAVTLPALEAAINAVLDATGVTADCAIVELREDRGFFNTYTPLGTGVATAFTKSGTTMTLTGISPTGNEIRRGCTITLAGATSAGNNGTFTITAVGASSFSYTNAAGVAEAFAGTWQVDSNADGRKTAYFSRGYRMTRQFTADVGSVSSARAAQSFIVILPYGTTAATALAVTEALRKKRAGGILVIVERRLNP